MPLTYISLRAGRSEACRRAICDSVHRAMHETYDVPDDNEFIVINEHDAANFRYSTSYLVIERSDDLVMIQIAANNTRTLAQKKALFRRLAELLAQSPGMRPQDVFVNLVEVPKENWSLGNGLAQYA